MVVVDWDQWDLSLPGVGVCACVCVCVRQIIATLSSSHPPGARFDPVSPFGPRHPPGRNPRGGGFYE